MATPMPATRFPRSKFGMYRQHLSERPRLLKHVLVSSASDIPDDNQFKSRKAKHVRRSICFEYTGPPTVAAGSAGKAVSSTKKESDTVRDALEQEFMERFIKIEGAPEELKFPVLRASHPGGRVFRTQELGTINRNSSHQRHPFNLMEPNAPPPEYSCYYDKNLKHFFHKPAIRKKLIEQGVITDDHFIREPYKAFKEYIRRKKLPHGTNPITQNPSQSPDPPKPPKLRSIFADEQIKEFVELKFNVNSAIVDEFYSGRRKGSVIPLKDSTTEDRKSSSPEHLPALRSSTPQKLAAMEMDLQQSLHHSRINVVVAKRQMLAQTKKSNAMHQGIVKQQKHSNNTRQEMSNDVEITSTCNTTDEASLWVYQCVVTQQTDLLNPAYICDRTTGHSTSFVFLYILISLFAMVSNSSVVLASIVERWKEIDQFTFVFAVSLSFNHFLVAFLVYPMTAYTMLNTNGWGLGNYWCTFTAYCTSYFEVLYMMHVLMILCDMVIYRFTSLKDVVKVFLVKKVAMSLWVTALIPHMLLIWNDKWFLLDGGTLGVKDKYTKCGEGGSEESLVINCYTAYTFTTYRELYIYLCCFWLIPVSYLVCFYLALLYIRKRSLFKGNRKGLDELNEEEALEKSRTFIERYKASVCMVVVFSVTQLPKWITSFYLLYKDTQAITAKENDPDYVFNVYGVEMVLGMDFLSFWTCIGSVMIPVCYMMTCPTYFHAVTSTKPLGWLRKFGFKIHGRTYSKRLVGSAATEDVDIPPSGNGIPLEKLSGSADNSTVIRNESCYENQGNGPVNGHVLGNGTTPPNERGERPLSQCSDTVLITPVVSSKRNSVMSDDVFSNGTDGYGIGKSEIDDKAKSCDQLSNNLPLSIAELKPSKNNEDKTLRNSTLSLDEKIQVKRKLPTPRNSTPTSPSSTLYQPVRANSPFFSGPQLPRSTLPSPSPSSHVNHPR